MSKDSIQILGFILILVGVSVALVSIPFKTAKTDDQRNFNIRGRDFSKVKMSIADQNKLGTKYLIVGLIIVLVGLTLFFI